jgi:O-antigen/teichoic acid export membrane protein
VSRACSVLSAVERPLLVLATPVDSLRRGRCKEVSVQDSSLLLRFQGTLSGVRGRLRQLDFLGNVFLLAGGTATAQVLTLLSYPILTRLYEPSDFGVLSVFLSVISPLAVITALRYDLAVPIAEDDTAAGNLLVLSGSIVVATTVLCAGFVWLLGGWVVAWFDGRISTLHLWLVPAALLVTGWYQALCSWLVRKGCFPRLAVSRLSQSAGQAAGQVGLGLLGLGPLGLMTGEIAGRTSGIVPLARSALRIGRRLLPLVSLAGIRGAAVRYRRFPLFSSWAGFLSSVGLWLPTILLAGCYDLQVVGWYALAQRVMGMPITLVSASVSRVYLSECARLNREAPWQLRGLFWKTLKAQCAMALGLALLVALPAPLVFGTLFGEGWAEAGWYVLILSFMFIPRFIAFPVISTLDVMERQDWNVLREILRIAAVGGAVLLGVRLGRGPMVTVGLLSIASCLTYVLTILLAWRSLECRGLPGGSCFDAAPANDPSRQGGSCLKGER